MDQRQIHEMAETAVKKVESGDRTGLYEELTSMGPADRLAVAKEMVQLNNRNRQTNDSLPIVEITTEIDASGQAVLVDVKAREHRGWYEPARWVDGEYDSGKAVYHSRFAKKADGSTSLTAIDPRTGRPGSDEVTRSNGFTQRTEYDPATGKLKSDGISFPDGSTYYADYDLTSEEPKFEVRTSPDGSNIFINHTEYDPATGKPRSQEYYGDGHIQRSVYDSKGLKSSEMIYPDGSIEHNVYGSKGLKSSEMIYPDGSGRRREYDPDTGKPKSVVELRVDGSTKGKN